MPESQAAIGVTVGRKYFNDFSAEELKACFLSCHELDDPLEELIATAISGFALIQAIEMSLKLKKAFAQLETQFEFYRKLIEMEIES